MTIKIWSKAGQCVKTLDVDGPVNCLALNECYMFSAVDKQVIAWQWATQPLPDLEESFAGASLKSGSRRSSRDETPSPTTGWIPTPPEMPGKTDKSGVLVLTMTPELPRKTPEKSDTQLDTTRASTNLEDNLPSLVIPGNNSHPIRPDVGNHDGEELNVG